MGIAAMTSVAAMVNIATFVVFIKIPFSLSTRAAPRMGAPSKAIQLKVSPPFSIRLPLTSETESAEDRCGGLLPGS